MIIDSYLYVNFVMMVVMITIECISLQVSSVRKTTVLDVMRRLLQVRGVMWCGMLWYAMLCYAMLWYGMLWYAMVCYGMLWFGMVRYGML